MMGVSRRSEWVVAYPDGTSVDPICYGLRVIRLQPFPTNHINESPTTQTGTRSSAATRQSTAAHSCERGFPLRHTHPIYGFSSSLIVFCEGI